MRQRAAKVMDDMVEKGQITVAAKDTWTMYVQSWFIVYQFATAV